MNIALILSGGKGTRVGGEIPKQYIKVGDKPIIIYCLETLCASSDIDAIQIVADENWEDEIRGWLDDYDLVQKFHGFSSPGETRQLSIYNGIRDIAEFADDKDLVLIHDAARPCLSLDLVNRCIKAIDGYDGVLPVLPMKDTVYLSKDGRSVSSLLDRNEVFAGQAPELFELSSYLKANESLIVSGEIKKIKGSTEPAIMAGLNIALISGDEANYKITTMADLKRFKRQIKEKK